MKYLAAMILLLIMISCKKGDHQSAHDQTPTILGKWNIVSDSVVSGIGPNISEQDYTGRQGDYFDFRSDSNVYIKENNTFDTLAYSLTTSDSIVIRSFGWTVNGAGIPSEILNLTAHTATIFAPNILNPGGYYQRRLHLSR